MCAKTTIAKRAILFKRFPILVACVALCLVSLTLFASENGSPLKEYAKGDPQICLACHGAQGVKPAHGIMSTVHGRTSLESGSDKRGCQTCHGPSQRHLTEYRNGKPSPTSISFNSNTPTDRQNEVCLSCHRKDASNHWQGSPHETAGVACSSCHSLHNPLGDKLLKTRTENELCVSCHRQTRADINKTSAHPIAEGQMDCKDCHNPHGSAADALLLRSSINDTCYSCHAEKRGPFLWEHAPVRESCTNCHAPHGSAHQAMLVTRGPFLCQQCHMAAYHPSTNYSGTSIPPNGAGHSVLAKNCMNCHTQVHGSNHPSGIRFTR